MGRLVLAMPHPVVAEAHGQKKFGVDHGGPELDFCLVFFEPPGMIGSLRDPPFYRMLGIDPAKFVLTGHPGNHAELETPSRARAGRDFDPRLWRILDKWRLARCGADFFERLDLRRKPGAVTRESEQIFDGAKGCEFLRGGCEEDRHAGAIGNATASDLARARHA